MKNNRETSTQANVAPTSKIEVLEKSSDDLREQEKFERIQQELGESIRKKVAFLKS